MSGKKRRLTTRSSGRTRVARPVRGTGRATRRAAERLRYPRSRRLSRSLSPPRPSARFQACPALRSSGARLQATTPRRLSPLLRDCHDPGPRRHATSYGVVAPHTHRDRPDALRSVWLDRAACRAAPKRGDRDRSARSAIMSVPLDSRPVQRLGRFRATLPVPRKSAVPAATKLSSVPALQSDALCSHLNPSGSPLQSPR